MTRRRALILVVVAHWIIAVAHLFIAARVLPAPDNTVSRVGVTLISLAHLGVVVAAWQLRETLAGWVLSLFFVAALGADLYEHVLRASANNVFMLARRVWTVGFVVSVGALLALEVIGLWLGILLLRYGTSEDAPLPSRGA